MRKIAFIILIFSFGAELSYLAQPITAHVLLNLGFPSTASKFFNDPSWKGLALYKAGRWNEAAAIFATNNEENYNLGNALARNGYYDQAIIAYERALIDQPDDEDAAYNKALLEAALQHHPTPLTLIFLNHFMTLLQPKQAEGAIALRLKTNLAAQALD